MAPTALRHWAEPRVRSLLGNEALFVLECSNIRNSELAFVLHESSLGAIVADKCYTMHEIVSILGIPSEQLPSLLLSREDSEKENEAVWFKLEDSGSGSGNSGIRRLRLEEARSLLKGVFHGNEKPLIHAFTIMCFL